MSDHVHDQTITETRLRTILRNATGNIIEFIIDFFLIDAIIGILMPTLIPIIKYLSSGALSALIELLCFCISYANDRAWNTIQKPISSETAETKS